MSDEEQPLGIGAEDIIKIRLNVETKTEEFAGLIDKIKNAPPEVRKIWKETYENATDDRAYATVLFNDLYIKVVASHDGHALYGKQLSMYLERMNRSNEQLLKLSELVSQLNEDEDIDADRLYAELEIESVNKHK